MYRWIFTQTPITRTFIMRHHLALKAMSLALSVILFSGCSKEHNFEKSVELQEIGVCSDGNGSFNRTKYTGFNFMSLYSIFFYYTKPDDFGFCIPNLDKNKVENLSVSEKQKLDAGVFNAHRKIRFHERIETETGQLNYVSSSLKDMQMLVEMGSELAYIDMHLFDYYQTFKRFNFTENNPYYSRLRELANQGDSEAQCLFSQRIPVPYEGYEDLLYNDAKARKRKGYMSQLIKARFENGPDDKWDKGLISAAKNGSSDCMAGYGYYLLKGEPRLGIDINKKEALKFLINASKKGSARAASILYLNYSIGKELPENLGKSRCWSEIYNRTFPTVLNKARLTDTEIKTRLAENQIFQAYSTNSFCQKEALITTK